MGLIKELPEHIANQIAAGEVIQRPASVVKELLENAIDSGATDIKVSIKDSGKTLIHVIDNGCGMDSIDSRNCFKRHATSKISAVNDLSQLKTKGFRGEALASIAAIAHVVLKSKQNENDVVGFETILSGGEIQSHKETICNKGTSLEVKNLFFNVPARRNFLKSDSVEFNHIRSEFQHIALAHHDVKFILIHNDQELLHLNPGNLKKRIVDIFGYQINDSLVPIEEQTNIIKIQGYISKPEKVKKSRGEQYFFVNNRYFRNNYFNHAVVKAFERLIPEKSYPTYFIYFEIDSAKIDVNVHPNKTEIKFVEDRFIYSILNSCIRRALGKHNVFPSLDFDSDNSFDIPHDIKRTNPKEPTIIVDPSYNPFSEKIDKNKSHSTGIRNLGFNEYKEDWEKLYSVKNVSAGEQTELNIEIPESYLVEENIIIKNKYLILSIDEGINIIDSKRAVQRVVFNQILEKFQHQPIASQQLLYGEKIDLTEDELQIIESNMTILNRLGFDGKIDKNCFEISGIPNVLSIDLFPQIFQEILETLKYRDLETEDIAYRLISKISTIASISSKINTKKEALALLTELFNCEEFLATSNGKKIIHSISLKEISTKF